MTESHGPCYYSVESPFVQYFRRCEEIGMTETEIRKNFPYLEKMYKEMVLNELSIDSVNRTAPSLEKLYKSVK